MQISDFEGLKKKIEDAKTRKAKAEGALEQAMTRLKDEFGCSTIDEAEEKLKQLQTEIDNDEIKLDSMLKSLDNSIDWNSL